MLPAFTVGELLRLATDRLAASGSDSARLDAELLLSHAVGVDRTGLITYPEAPVGEFAPAHLLILLIVALLAFGSKRLPEIARGVGQGVREFRDSVTGHETPEAHTPPAPPVDQPVPPAVNQASESPVAPAGTNSSPTGPA